MTKDEKQCPFCAETIKKSAIKCRFCQSELTTSNKAKVTNTVSNKDSTGSKIGALILLIAIFFIIRTCSSGNKEEQKVAEKKVDIVEELVSAPISTPYIDPEKLTSTFQFFSDYTDLQREKLERDLNGKVVIWELEVYDIKSTKDPKVFKIQTSDGTSKSESLGLAGVNKELDSQLGKLFQGWSDEINKSISGKKTNHSVGTWITLHTRNASDVSELESLKTGSLIKVKGRINGTFLRAINLNPAIIYHKTDDIKQAETLKEPGEAPAVTYKNVKDCKMSDPKFSFVSFDEIKSQDLVNYIDQSGKILVHYGRGNQSSDIEIYNLDSNTFTKINNNYKENNESRKLSEEDLGTFNSYQSGSNAICKFHYDLIISDEFRCQLRGSNFICDWLKNIPK